MSVTHPTGTRQHAPGCEPEPHGEGVQVEAGNVLPPCMMQVLTLLTIRHMPLGRQQARPCMAHEVGQVPKNTKVPPLIVHCAGFPVTMKHPPPGVQQAP